ncbi:MAG: hypothetical protein ACTSYI_06270 [Promethearchaeota archaeon]
MSENPEDSIDLFNQDFFSKIRSLKKAGQYYTLTRLLAGFIRSAQEASINVSEYEFYLQKYYKAEKTENDLQPQEIEALLSAYDDRFKSILDHSPPKLDIATFVSTESSPPEIDENSLMLEIINNISQQEEDQEKLSLTEVKSLKDIAYNQPTPGFKSKETET